MEVVEEPSEVEDVEKVGKMEKEGKTGLVAKTAKVGSAGKMEKRDFHHPYTPYDIQVEFMETVYGVLEKGGGGVGILESPTGTVSAAFLFFGDLGNLGWGGDWGVVALKGFFFVHRTDAMHRGSHSV
jgi:hypothetical protein